MSFAVISDIHYGFPDVPDHRVKEGLVGIFNSIEREDVDHLLILGDIIHEREQGNHRRLGEVVTISSEYPFETHFAAGNHDANVFTCTGFEASVGNNLVEYIEDINVLLFDTAFGAPVDNVGMIGDRTLKKIDNLCEDIESPIFATHFPVVYDSIYQESIWFDEYPEGVFPIDKVYLEDIDIEPRQYLFGHLHIGHTNENVNFVKPFMDIQGEEASKAKINENAYMFVE